jgi:deoxyinosine 3'endonuclease (endonuclease V)
VKDDELAIIAAADVAFSGKTVARCVAVAV